MYPHLMEGEVAAFVDGRVENPRRSQLAIHLYGCPGCAKALHKLHPTRGPQRLAEVLGLPEPPPVEPPELARFALEIVENDPGLSVWEFLQDRPSGERSLRLRNLPEDQKTVGMIMALLDESKRLWHESAKDAADLASQALSMVRKLEEGGFRIPRLLGDLGAQALAYLGNAERIQGDLRSAEPRLRAAIVVMFLAGSGDTRLIGTLLRLYGKARRDAEEFEQARLLYESAQACFEKSEDLESVATIELDRAVLLAEQGQVEEATASLRNLIQADHFPSLRLIARLSANQQLAFRLCEIAKFFEARKLLPEVDRLSGLVGGELNLLKVRWLKARVAAGTKRAKTAETYYLGIRDRLVEMGHSMDAALVTLELAEVYLGWGRPEEAREQAAVALEVCRSMEGLRREELEAVATLVQAEEDCLERTLESLRMLLKETRRPAETLDAP